MFKMKMVTEDVYVLHGGANTILIANDNEAMLVNCPTKVPLRLFKDKAINTVSKIIFTHHRRELADGLEDTLENHHPVLGAPNNEACLFEYPLKYWSDYNSRWELLMGDHVPYHATHISPIKLDERYCDGDTFEWHSWQVSVLETPGYTDGSVSYILKHGNITIALTGDLIYGAGQLNDLYSLQHGEQRGERKVGDYHGFIGSLDTLKRSLNNVLSYNPDILIPAHGEIMTHPKEAVRLLEENLDNLYRNYTQVSALRWYFPDYFTDWNDPNALQRQHVQALPPYMKKIAGTTWVLISERNRAILIDPASQDAINVAKDMINNGDIEGFDYIWITHYHYDHLDFLPQAVAEFKCPVTTDKILADVVENPEAYFLPCLKNVSVTVELPREHSETWQWENFMLTSYHLPGQTYYHSGLLVVNHLNERCFFVGDSFSPTGIDDYCSWNRNFLGEHAGFDRCIEIVQQAKPDLLVNQHIECAFNFTEKAFKYILAKLNEREELLKEILPWTHPNFGLDESWVHAYPYEQNLAVGASGQIKMNVFNHSQLVTPVGIQITSTDSIKFNSDALSSNIPPKQQSTFTFDLQIADKAPKGKYVIPVKIEWNDNSLGTFKEFIVNVI